MGTRPDFSGHDRRRIFSQFHFAFLFSNHFFSYIRAPRPRSPMIYVRGISSSWSFFSFHFRHHFSVGAGGAGSIDCISSLQRQLNSYTLGKGKARILKVHTKREAMAHSFVACFGEEPATERSGWETFAVYMLRHWMCKAFWFRLFIRRHSCLEKI